MQRLLVVTVAALAGWSSRQVVLDLAQCLTGTDRIASGSATGVVSLAVLLLPLLVGIGVWRSGRAWDGRHPLPGGLRVAGALIAAWVVLDAVLVYLLLSSDDVQTSGLLYRVGPPAAWLVTLVAVYRALRSPVRSAV